MLWHQKVFLAKMGNWGKMEDLNFLMYLLKTNILRLILMRQNDDITKFFISRNIEFTIVIFRSSSTQQEDEPQ